MLPVVSHEIRTRRWPYVTVCLIGLNVLVFLFEASLGVGLAPFLQDWGMVPARIGAGPSLHNIATVGTSVFLHAGVVHLFVNMWFLFVFGDAVEDAFGPWWFLALYLLCGFFGGMTFVAVHSGSPLPVVGASAAVSGVMAASLVLWPRATLRVPGLLLGGLGAVLLYSGLVGLGVGSSPAVALAVVLAVALGAVTIGLADGPFDGLLRGLRVPVWIVLGLYFLLQLFNGLLAVADPVYGDSVGWWAHIGGFVAGALIAVVFPKTPLRRARTAVVS